MIELFKRLFVQLTDARWCQIEHERDFMEVEFMLIEQGEQQLIALRHFAKCGV